MTSPEARRLPVPRRLPTARRVRALEAKLRRAERVAEANLRMALTDPLTGLPNRRHLKRHLARFPARGSRRPLSLVLIDVDDFKSFNDRHGYVAGDRALAAVGTVLLGIRSGPAGRAEAGDFARGPDRRPGPTRCLSFAARLGGDEFVVVLPGATRNEARDIARHIARAAARHPPLAARGVTVSFGIAAAHRSGTRGFDELLAVADHDLRRRRSLRPPPTSRRRPARVTDRDVSRRSPGRSPDHSRRTAAMNQTRKTLDPGQPDRPPGGAGLRDLERAAEELARAAGAVALGYFGADVGVETKADDTPVTIADRAAEGLLRAEIERRYPGHGIVGEEYGEARPGASVRWILDPIDGTRSFVRGVPLWGVLIGIEVEGQPVAGVAHFPALGETVTAAKDRGCRWNGRPCAVSAESRLDRSLVLTTDEAAFHGHPAEAGWRALAAAARMTRGWGDCYGHILVATGRAQAMVDPVLASWDAAPLLTILTEAGGCFTDLSGTPTIHGGSGVSSTPGLHARVLELLAAGAAPER